MIPKTVVMGLACGLAVGAFLLLRTTERPAAEPSGQHVLPGDRAAVARTIPSESPAAREARPAGDSVADSDETRELRIQRVRFARLASLNRLGRRLNAATLSNDPAARDRLQTLLAEWMQHDPDEAAQFARSLAAGEAREQALHRVAQLWAAQDPTGAERWARQLDDPAERASALTDLCLQLAQTNAAQAVAKAEAYKLDAAPGTVLVDLAQQWAEQDLRGAADWIEARPAGEEREQMLWRLAIAQSATAPAEAVRLVTEQIPAGPIQTEAAISVLHQWAVRDLEGARAWVALFPAGAVRERAENELAGIAAYQR